MTTFTMNAQKPVAYDSPDHIQPWGTVNDNSINYCFNLKLMWWLPRPYLKVLDIGCAGRFREVPDQLQVCGGGRRRE